MVVALVAVFVVLSARHTFAEAEHKLHLVRPPVLVGAGLLVLAGTYLMMLSWRVLLTQLGARLPLAAASRIYFLGQLGKYLPGSVWPVAAQAQLGRKHGLSRTVTATAAIVTMGLSVVVALLVAALFLPLGHPSSVAHYWWAFAVLPVGLVVLAPPVLNRLVALGLRILRRAPLEESLTLRVVLQSAGWALAGWLVYGVSLWMLVRPLGGHGAAAVPLSIGAMALAWDVGFLVVLAPAGGVVREVALKLLLSAVLVPASGLAVALLSRLLFTVADIVWGLVALVGRRREIQHAPAPVVESGKAA